MTTDIAVVGYINIHKPVTFTGPAIHTVAGRDAGGSEVHGQCESAGNVSEGRLHHENRRGGFQLRDSTWTWRHGFCRIMGMGASIMVTVYDSEAMI